MIPVGNATARADTRRGRARRLISGLGVWLVVALPPNQQARAQAESPFRYDDDVSAYAAAGGRETFYGSLKDTPLGGDAGDYLSFGGDLRERVEVNSDALVGLGGKGQNAYGLHRLLLFADLHDEGFQAFIQLGDETEAGRAPAPLPTDIDRGDLAQGFFGYAFAAGPGKLTVRGGRFEMAYDEGALIGLRDGPNVRQVWDGFQAFYVLPEARADAFVVKPVNVGRGWFDDRDVAGQTLWGVHFEAVPAPAGPLKITGFYYGDTMPDVRFHPRPGKEETQTVGLRLLSSQAGFDGSVGGIGQVGAFAGRSVLAWAAHADAGYAFKASWAPRLGLRSDILSGGGARGAVHTFNALYPNYAYSTEATIEAPSNLIQVGGTLGLHPVEAVTVGCTLEGLWRYSVRDAFYAAPTSALAPPDGTSRRFSGVEEQVEAAWRIDEFLVLTGAYVHFEPAAFLRSAHARPQDFGMTEIALRF